MLSAPGLRFHRIDTFLSAGCGACPSSCLMGVRIHPFLYFGFLVLVFIYFYYCFILFCVYCNARAPASLGSPGWVFMLG